MVQEEKDLLLKDLCARLPYGVIVKTTGDNESYTLLSINMNKNIALIGLNFDGVYATSKIKINEVKPYLRSMSSMTEDECKELGELPTTIENISEILPNTPYFIEVVRPEQIDWLNKRMFDYRGLIEKGLAIEVTKSNNPYKE